MQLLLYFKTTAICSVYSKKVLLILLLVQIYVNCITAERTCHHCRGINCQRSSYEVTQKCSNNLDICVTVFDGQTIQAQGCLEQLSQDLRTKCSSSLDNEQLIECHKCNENLCNNLASSSFKCIQCDSDTDTNCLSYPLSLEPSRCLISRTPNEYCFVKKDGNRVIRGCFSTLEEQKTCLWAEGCTICQPIEISGCNSITLNADSPGDGVSGCGSGSGDGGSESWSGDEGSNSGSGSGNGNSGGGGSDSSSGSGNEGSGSGPGGSGSGSGDGGFGDGGSGSANGSEDGGSGSGSGDGGSGSGSGDGGPGTGNGSGGKGTNGIATNTLFLIFNIIFAYLLRK